MCEGVAGRWRELRSEIGRVSWVGRETGWQLGQEGDRLGVCKGTVWLGKKKLGQEMKQNDKEHGQRGALQYV